MSRATSWAANDVGDEYVDERAITGMREEKASNSMDGADHAFTPGNVLSSQAWC